MNTTRPASHARSGAAGAAMCLVCLGAGCDSGPRAGLDLEPPDLGPGPCLDVPPVRLGDDPDRAVRPGLAWDGERFGVAFVEGDDAAGTVVFETLARSGEVLGAPVALSTGAPAMSPRVSAAADGFGVVWYEGAGDRDIRFRRVDAGGRPSGPPVNVSETPGWSYAADLDQRDGTFGVTWLDDSRGGLQTWFRRLDESGNPRGSARVLTKGRERAARPAVVAAEAGWAVAWTRWPDGRDPVYLTLLDAEGAPGDPTLLAPDDGPASHPALVGTDDGFLVAWDDGQGGGRILARAVDSRGVARDVPLSVAGDAPEATMPSLARAADGRLGLVWSDARADSDGLDLWFRLLDARGRPVSAPLRVSDRPGDDLQGVLAWDGTGFGVSWFASDGADEQVYFAHVRAECDPRAR